MKRGCRSGTRPAASANVVPAAAEWTGHGMSCPTVPHTQGRTEGRNPQVRTGLGRDEELRHEGDRPTLDLLDGAGRVSIAHASIRANRSCQVFSRSSQWAGPRRDSCRCTGPAHLGRKCVANPSCGADVRTALDHRLAQARGRVRAGEVSASAGKVSTRIALASLRSREVVDAVSPLLADRLVLVRPGSWDVRGQFPAGARGKSGIANTPVPA